MGNFEGRQLAAGFFVVLGVATILVTPTGIVVHEIDTEAAILLPFSLLSGASATATGLGLWYHQEDYNGQAMDCQSCHLQDNFVQASLDCVTCHAAEDHELMATHIDDACVGQHEVNETHVCEIVGHLVDEMRYRPLALQARMLEMDRLFQLFQRPVRDLAQAENKKINLVVNGGDTKIHKTIFEIISDPIMHMVRNAISHGIAGHEERTRLGKEPGGSLILSARHDGSSAADAGDREDARRDLRSGGSATRSSGIAEHRAGPVVPAPQRLRSGLGVGRAGVGHNSGDAPGRLLKSRARVGPPRVAPWSS